jgi:hypothetical protein
MSPFLGAETTPNSHADGAAHANALLTGTRSALQQLLAKASEQLPEESLSHINRVDFSTANTGSPYFPSPLKQTEAISALKAVEAGIASSIADLKDGSTSRSINVDLERATAFLFSTYLATVGGMDKANPKVKKLLKGQCYQASLNTLIVNPARYRSSPSTVYIVSETVRESLRD